VFKKYLRVRLEAVWLLKIVKMPITVLFASLCRLFMIMLCKYIFIKAEKKAHELFFQLKLNKALQKVLK